MSKRFLCTLLLLSVSAISHATENAPSQAQAHVAHSSASNMDSTTSLDNHTTMSDVAAFNDDFTALLESDAYSDHFEYSKWQRKPKDYEALDLPERNLPDIDLGFIANLWQSLAIMIKTILLLLLAACVLWLLRYYNKLSLITDKLLPSRSASLPLPNFSRQLYLFDDLPEHHALADVVAAHIARGEYLLALSMLYRGSLRVMKLKFDLPISHSETEQQCQALLHRARHQHPDELKFFDALVRLWQQAAYGKRLPAGDVKGELTVLLSAWRRLYPSLAAAQTAQGGVS